jgi:hypothetical protein
VIIDGAVGTPDKKSTTRRYGIFFYGVSLQRVVGTGCPHHRTRGAHPTPAPQLSICEDRRAGAKTSLLEHACDSRGVRMLFNQPSGSPRVPCGSAGSSRTRSVGHKDPDNARRGKSRPSKSSNYHQMHPPSACRPALGPETRPDEPRSSALPHHRSGAPQPQSMAPQPTPADAVHLRALRIARAGLRQAIRAAAVSWARGVLRLRSRPAPPRIAGSPHGPGSPFSS